MPDFLDLWVFIWAALVIATIIIEAMSAELTSIWFTVGAFAALLANVLGASTIWQVVIFLVVSAGLLIAMRPLVKRLTKQKKARFNADKVLGTQVTVTKRVSVDEIGEVRAETVLWRAIPGDDSTFEVGEKGIVTEIRGTKLVIKKGENK